MRGEHGGFEVVNDFLGQNVGIGKIVGVWEALVLKPEDVKAGFVAADAKDSSFPDQTP